MFQPNNILDRIQVNHMRVKKKLSQYYRNAILLSVISGHKDPVEA